MKNIDLFMKLFSGRMDCWGMNQVCLKEPLTKEIYEKHINGFQRIGVYPIVDTCMTNWIACDIDDADFNKAKEIQWKADHHGLKTFLERSKSKGFHEWCFFDKPVEAVKARLVFEMILKELNIVCEMFPKQDFVEDGKYGNFIFLPLYGGDIRNGKTIFVDNMDRPLIESIEFLNKIEVNKGEILDTIIADNELKRKQEYAADSNGEFKPLLKPKPCIEKIKEIGVRAGQRNTACFRLAVHYKQMKIPIEEVLTLIGAWNSKNIKPLDNKEIYIIVDSVFKNDYKTFSCEEPTLAEFCDKTTCPIIQAHDIKKDIAEGIITMTFRNDDVMIFKKKNYEFRFSNFEFTKSGKFKSSLTLSRDNEMLHRDIINLDMASNRKKFVMSSEDKEMDCDLVSLDDLIRKQLNKEEKEKILESKQPYIMTEQEKEEAVRFLKETPNILSKVIEVTNTMGVIGEENLRLMIYLCFTSRIIEEPLSITIKGESSSGKSFACQTVQRIIPEEGYHFVTRATQNAFYHLPEDGMQHRIIYINEIPGSESADYSIRSVQSEGDLILMMPVKDPVTGNQETITKRVKGPAGFMITTTKAKGNAENETRNFSLFSDDSPELTKKIGSITSQKAIGMDFKLGEKEINLWKNIQRLLNPDFRVIMPYAVEVFDSFPDKPVRIRRDRERFRVLIDIITILHQYHREQKKNEKTGRMMLISTLADYYIAKRIAEYILMYTIYEISPSAEELWKTIRRMEEAFHSEPGNSAAVFTFKYKDVAEAINWKTEKVKKWIYALMINGLIEYSEKGNEGKGGRNKASTFQITGHYSSAFLQLKEKEKELCFRESLCFLPSIRSLYDKYPCDRTLFYDPFTGINIDIDKEKDIEKLDVPQGLLDEENEEEDEEKGVEKVEKKEQESWEE